MTINGELIKRINASCAEIFRSPFPSDPPFSHGRRGDYILFGLIQAPQDGMRQQQRGGAAARGQSGRAPPRDGTRLLLQGVAAAPGRERSALEWKVREQHVGSQGAFREGGGAAVPLLGSLPQS